MLEVQCIGRFSGKQMAFRVFQMWRSGLGTGVDDDGSTMMQGLLMRERNA